jgi:hypothetical protein
MYCTVKVYEIGATKHCCNVTMASLQSSVTNGCGKKWEGA